MNFVSKSKILLISGLALGSLVSVTTFAAVPHLAQKCALGEVCSIPGNDGGITYIDITPSSGTKYKCDFKSINGSMRVWVSGGKEFNATQGIRYFKIDPQATVVVEGTFKNPQNLADVGQLKFRKLTGAGTVICTSVR